MEQQCSTSYAPQPASSQPAAPSADERAQLRDKYGDGARHMYMSREQVVGMVDDALHKSATVKYMLDALKKNGCGVGRTFFSVVKCDAQTGGGFSQDDGILICYNKLKNYRDVELALTHELIHAYDHCRAANLDLTNCYHHACTEVRAASLSGDCSAMQEFLRGNLSTSFIGQHKKCVRRRATMSVQMNPYCSGAMAEQAVNEVFSKCLQDTDPFDSIPGSQ